MKLTPARQRGLAVLAAAEDTGHAVRVSNVTSSPQHPPRYVYWQVAYWLRDNSLATITGGSQGDFVLRLTDRGRQVAKGTDHG